MKGKNLWFLAVLLVCMVPLLFAATVQADEIQELKQKMEALYEQGRYAEAIPIAQKVLALARSRLGEDHPHTATCYNNLAALYRATGRYGEAEPLMKKALEIYRTTLGEDHPHTALSYNNLAELYLAQGKMDSAEAIFSKRDEETGLALVALKRGDYARARRGMEEYLGEMKKRGATEDQIGALIGLGLAWEGLGDPARAQKAFFEAVDLMEAQREKLTVGAKEGFLGGRTKLGFSRLEGYEGLIRVLSKTGTEASARQALQVAERAKARLFYELLAHRQIRGRSPAEDELLSRELTLRSRLATLSASLAAMQEKKVEEAHIATVRKELEETRREHERVVADLERQGSSLAQVFAVRPPEVAPLQKRLEPGVTVLEYFVGEEATYAWVVTRDKIQLSAIPRGNKALMELARAGVPGTGGSSRTLREKLGAMMPEEKAPYDAGSHAKLYEAIVKPVEAQLAGTQTLVIIPHGVLHKVAFAALSHNGVPLADRFALATAPSFSTLPLGAPSSSDRPRSLLALANPLAPGTDPLEFAEREAAAISKLFARKAVYAREKALEKTLKTQAGKQEVVHLATHALFFDLQPLDSAVILREGQGEDGLLRVSEVFGLDLRGSRLVALSGCQSELGEIRPGDGMVALSRAFLHAGAPALLVSLCALDDEATCRLMEAFYANWMEKGLSKAEALRRAQKAVRQAGYNDPRYWAAFQLVGDWR